MLCAIGCPGMCDSHKKARLWGQAGQYREVGASTRCLESRLGAADCKEADTRSPALAGRSYLAAAVGGAAAVMSSTAKTSVLIILSFCSAE